MNKDNVEVRFYSVVTCLSQFCIMYFSQVPCIDDIGTILIQGCSFIIALILCFYVVKNEQETDSLGLSGQNQDDKLHRREQRVAFNTWLFLHCIQYIITQVFVGLYMHQS